MTERPELTALIKASIESYNALSPVDRALADVAQMESFVRGNLGLDGVKVPDRFTGAASVLAEEVRRLRAECDAKAREVERLTAERDEESDLSATYSDIILKHAKLIESLYTDRDSLSSLLGKAREALRPCGNVVGGDFINNASAIRALVAEIDAHLKAVTTHSDTAGAGDNGEGT